MEILRGKLNEKVFRALLEANISLDMLLTIDEVILQDKTTLSQGEIKVAIDNASNLFLGQQILTGNQVATWKRISTGCYNIDSIIRGGIPVNGITEIVGCSGVGKTQFCLQLSMMAQLHEHAGVIYICTEDAFPVKRCMQLAEACRQKYLTSLKFEDSIFIQHVTDYVIHRCKCGAVIYLPDYFQNQLHGCLCSEIPQLVRNRKIALIVIDSIAGIFRSENEDVNYVTRSQDFVSLASKLIRISNKYKAAVLCINQVTENIEDNRTDPCLGLAWSNLITSRLNITRHNESDVRNLEIVFGPDLEDRHCNFRINTEGLVDI